MEGRETYTNVIPGLEVENNKEKKWGLPIKENRQALKLRPINLKTVTTILRKPPISKELLT